MLAALWRSFFAICCFRKAPQDLPVSRELLIMCLLVYAFSSFLLALLTQPPQIAMLSGLIETVLLAAITYGFLLIWRLPERWIQATIAIFGTGIIFSVGTIPLSYLFVYIGNKNPLALLLYIFVISLWVWNIGVMAHIMRHALSSSFALGVLVAVLYVWVIIDTITSLFPQPGTLS
jgi:hypothetical protein